MARSRALVSRRTQRIEPGESLNEVAAGGRHGTQENDPGQGPGIGDPVVQPDGGTPGQPDEG